MRKISLNKTMNEIGTYSAIDDFEGSAVYPTNSSDNELQNWTFTEQNSFYFESMNGTGELKPSQQFANRSTTDTDEIVFPTDMVIFGAVCMILFAQFAIVGNFVSIWALTKSKKLRKVTTAFIVNICVADFFLSCCHLVSAAVIAKNKYWNGDKTCKPYNIILIYFATVSTAALVTITINRFILIVYPRIYQALFSKRSTSIIIALTWLFPMGLTLAIYFKVWSMFGYDRNTGECAITDLNGNTEPSTFIAGYIFPLALIIICYAKILYVVRKAERRAQRHRTNIMSYIANLSDKYLLEAQENETGKASYKHLRNKKEWRIFQMIMVILVCYILCFIPLAVMKVFNKEREYPRTYIVCHLGIHLTNVLNPIIYIVMSEDYRQAYKELLTCKKRP